MPTYEYHCDSCDHAFEEFQSMKDDPIKECPKCGEPVRKLISAGAGLIFKGSGFYITDYKNKKSSSPSNGNGKKTSAEKKTETKTDKAATKTETTTK
jgi:putative FmdB family regulatory protein